MFVADLELIENLLLKFIKSDLSKKTIKTLELTYLDMYANKFKKETGIYSMIYVKELP